MRSCCGADAELAFALLGAAVAARDLFRGIDLGAAGSAALVAGADGGAALVADESCYGARRQRT